MSSTASCQFLSMVLPVTQVWMGGCYGCQYDIDKCSLCWQWMFCEQGHFITGKTVELGNSLQGNFGIWKEIFWWMEILPLYIKKNTLEVVGNLQFFEVEHCFPHLNCSNHVLWKLGSINVIHTVKKTVLFIGSNILWLLTVEYIWPHKIKNAICALQINCNLLPSGNFFAEMNNQIFQ